MNDVERRLIAATYEQGLAAVAEQMLDDPAITDEDRERARAARRACSSVGARVAREFSQVVEVLSEAGVEFRTVATDHFDELQHHSIVLDVDDVGTGEAAADALCRAGWDRWERWTGGALESFHRHAGVVTLARTADVTMVVRLRWRRIGPRTTFERITRPTSADWGFVDLPQRLWWLYSAVRPVRHLAEMLRLRPRQTAKLGPFMATPDNLLEPLFDFAGLTASDIALDIGCGDGRIAVAANRLRGCRAFGIESDARLAALARDAVSDAGLADVVHIEEGDALDMDLPHVTVIFIFLPILVIADLLAGVLDAMPAGARLVVHEQARLPPIDRPPEISRVLIADGAITVAHRWTAR